MIADGGTIAYYVTTTRSWTVMVADAGVPENITGLTIYFTIKESKADADPGVFQTTLAIIDGPGGEARLNLVPLDLSAVAQGSYHADLKFIKTATTEVYLLWEGRISLIKPVTDAIT